jgi:aminopeptidase-like protein
MKLFKIGILFTLIITIIGCNAQSIQKEQKAILAGLTGKTNIKNHKLLNDRYSLENRTIAQDFLGDWIKGLKLNLKEHPYKIDIIRKGVTKNFEGKNIYTIIPATTKSDEYIIIGAHFDSVKNCPGANDNATGCALVYGVAKQISNLKNRTKNVIVVYFDQEELGLVGSQAFTKFIKEKKFNVHSVHTVDQMGWDKDKDRNIEIEIPTPFLKSIYQKHAKKLGISAFVTPEAGSDHRAFRNEGFNAVGITEEYRNKDTTPHYHKNTDTYETVDFKYLYFSTNLVFNVIEELITK